MQRFLRLIAALCFTIVVSLALVNTSAIAKSETKNMASNTVRVALNQVKQMRETEPIQGYIDEEASLLQWEIELIALVTMAEAEDECEEGKRLVIDTILNRVDCEDFPNSVEGVIYQPSQFSSMWNGRVNRCYVKDDICQLVREELLHRTNSEVMFFTAGHYGKYGTPMFSVENHYFSSRE